MKKVAPPPPTRARYLFPRFNPASFGDCVPRNMDPPSASIPASMFLVVDLHTCKPTPPPGGGDCNACPNCHQKHVETPPSTVPPGSFLWAGLSVCAEDGLPGTRHPQGWADFAAKMNRSKKLGGVFHTKHRESLFKSPASVDGRVGVMWSGKAMTEDSKFRPLSKGDKP